MVFTPSCARHSRLRGFSLVELSIVVAILSVVAALGLEAAANFVNRTSTSVSRERVAVVDDAVAKFFKVFGRLPCPAMRAGAAGSAADPANAAYGIEDCTTTVWVNGAGAGDGVYIGAVPFRSLNLPMLYSLDGFASKLNYVVTKNLTVAGGSATVQRRFASYGGGINKTGMGGIEVRTGVLAEPCVGKCQKVADPAATPPNGAAYFIFSTGADQRGGVNARGTAQNACIVYASESRVDTENCLFGGVHTGMSVTTIPNNVFYDNRYNAGLNRNSYYDDVAAWRTKGQL